MLNFVPSANDLYFSGESISPEKLEQLEHAFFAALKLRNGTFKRTYHRRLDDLNGLVARFLPPERPLRIMDVAASSGVSTGEWLASLQGAGIEHRMLAGDMMVDAFLIGVGERLRLLVDKTGHALQFDIHGKAVVRRRELFQRLPYVLFLKLAAALARLRYGRVARAGTAPQPGEFCGITWRPLKLVSPSLRRFPALEVIEDDILSDCQFENAFHVIRAANILNRSYFSEAVLTAMIQNLRRRLKAGGLFIVCRTNERNTNNATIFALRPDGSFDAIARLNEGSEVEALVLSAPRAANSSAT